MSTSFAIVSGTHRVSQLRSPHRARNAKVTETAGPYRRDDEGCRLFGRRPACSRGDRLLDVVSAERRKFASDKCEPCGPVSACFVHLRAAREYDQPDREPIPRFQNERGVRQHSYRRVLGGSGGGAPGLAVGQKRFVRNLLVAAQTMVARRQSNGFTGWSLLRIREVATGRRELFEERGHSHFN